MSHPYTGQKKIKEIIYRLIEPTLERQGWYLSKIIMNWEMLIGEEWKDHVLPTRFVHNIKNRSCGTLHMKATPKGMQHIQFTKGFLIEKLNLYLGCDAILDIKPQLWHHNIISKNPSQPVTKTSQLTVENIQDPKLKEALEELGRTLL